LLRQNITAVSHSLWSVGGNLFHNTLKLTANIYPDERKLGWCGCCAQTQMQLYK